MCKEKDPKVLINEEYIRKWKYYFGVFLNEKFPEEYQDKIE